MNSAITEGPRDALC